MAATLEPIVVVCGMPHVWIARSGPAHHQHGDPYQSSCVIIRKDSSTALIEGMSGGSSSIKDLLALRPILRAEGFRRVRWQRIRNVEVDLAHDSKAGC